MAALGSIPFRPEKLASAIERAKEKIGPDAIWIRYRTLLDHSDEPAIEVKVMLPDSAILPDTLGPVTRRIREIVWDEVEPYQEFSMRMYFRFRGESEQAKMKDADWA